MADRRSKAKAVIPLVIIGGVVLHLSDTQGFNGRARNSPTSLTAADLRSESLARAAKDQRPCATALELVGSYGEWTVGISTPTRSGEEALQIGVLLDGVRVETLRTFEVEAQGAVAGARVLDESRPAFAAPVTDDIGVFAGATSAAYAVGRSPDGLSRIKATITWKAFSIDQAESVVFEMMKVGNRYTFRAQEIELTTDQGRSIC